MGKKGLNFFLILFIGSIVFSQNTANTLNSPQIMQSVLDSLSLKYPEIISNPEKYKLKVVFSQINRTKNKIALETVTYRQDQNEYIYPASIVKLPTILVSLEQFNEIKQSSPKVNLNNTIKFFQKKGCLTTTNQIKIGNRFYPTSLEVLIKMMLAVSDNEAYNRMFEFSGQQRLNKRIKEVGYNKGKILRKFVQNCNLNQNRISDSIVIYGKNNENLFSRGVIVNNDSIYADTLFKLGSEYEGLNKQMIKKPFDFSKQNNIEILDIHKTLSGIVLPKSTSNYHFNITEDQRNFLLQNLGRYPDEYGLAYNSLEYFPAYKKYLFYGRNPNLNYSSDTLTRFRSFNIVGLSFGCVIDCAYLVDFKSGKEFILTVGMYANKDDIINDGKYDYDNIAFPFMKDIGQLFMKSVPDNPAAIPYLDKFIKDLGYRR